MTIASMSRSDARGRPTISVFGNLPPRPTGQHVVADLMATYFRSTEANDDCYKAMINREVCRPIAITTRKPEAKA